MANRTEQLKQSGLRIARTALPDLENQVKVISENNVSELQNFLSEGSQEITMVLTLDGQIRFVNAALKTVLGYEPFKLLGTNIQKIIPVNQWVAFRAALRASEEESSKGIGIDCQFIDASDIRSFFGIRVKDYRYHPQVEGYVIYASKIQRQKQLEDKLKLRNLAIEQIKEAVVIIDPLQKKLLFANKAFYSLSGFTPQEVIGGKFDLFKPPYSDMLFDERTDLKQKEKFFKAIRNITKFEGRIYSKKKNGTVFYNRFSMNPVLDSENQLTHFIVSMKSINSRRKSS